MRLLVRYNKTRHFPEFNLSNKMKTPDSLGWYRQSPIARLRDEIPTKAPLHWSWRKDRERTKRPRQSAKDRAHSQAIALLASLLK
jgi:hypothetical protein